MVRVRQEKPLITGLLIHATFATFHHPEVERWWSGPDQVPTVQPWLWMRGVMSVAQSLSLYVA